jgi:anaerobic selenocysteine-containing dehydrogenase
MPEDVWVKSNCNLCLNACAIRVHRVDGVVVKIEGNPDCPSSKGRICPRGMTGMMLLYDPNRVNVPLKRTNPVKGIGVDPKWAEITWDEALDIITEKLKKIKAEDPRKFLSTRSPNTHDISMANRCFGKALGSPNTWHSGGGAHCGNGMHLFSGMIYSAWGRMFDPYYTNYYLNFGCSDGFGVGYGVAYMAERMADAKARGMRSVVIDPSMGRAALKADEWIPIKPGTDAAMVLAMVNLLLNEYQMYDADFIKYKTNGPYLIKEDGHYLRDSNTSKPMVWDPVDNKAKTYDDPTIKDLALEGSYDVDSTSAKPAFSLIKEHVKKYTPEMASQLTTVPAQTIRRLAREFGEAARIGSTIVIDGKTMPYRPVAVAYFRGAEAHRHTALTCMSFELLQQIVGAVNVPGGEISLNACSLGYPETGSHAYSPYESVDGILAPGLWHHPQTPWPTKDPQKPESVMMTELSPTVVATSSLVPLAIIDREKYKIPYKIEFNMVTGSNYIMTVADPGMMEKAFKDVFTVSFSLYLDESTEFADIVLPDACYLERLDVRVDVPSSNSPVDAWSFHIRQPVVEPMYQRRSVQEVLLELAERVGILGEMYEELNHALELKEPYLLDPTKKYTWEEIVDRRYKSLAGPDKGLAWFRENGLLAWPKTVEEVYWRCFVKGRTEIYFEHFKTLGEKIEKIKKNYGIPGFNTEDFQAMPDWKPCASHEEKRPEFDLYGFYTSSPIHTHTSTYNNPWLDEVARLDPWMYDIAINTLTAGKKGIRDGDILIIESAATGNKVEGRAKLTEAIHPEAVAYIRGRGHWSEHLPIASKRSEGVCPTWLIPLDWDHLDTVAFNQDLCTKVKVTKKG